MTHPATGFDYVFDANFSADLTIMEEGSELLRRLRKAWGLELPAEQGALLLRVSSGRGGAETIRRTRFQLCASQAPTNATMQDVTLCS